MNWNELLGKLNELENTEVNSEHDYFVVPLFTEPIIDQDGWSYIPSLVVHCYKHDDLYWISFQDTDNESVYVTVNGTDLSAVVKDFTEQCNSLCRRLSSVLVHLAN